MTCTPTPQDLASESMGPCQNLICGGLGTWLPFYRGYVCRGCLASDQADVLAGRRPEWWDKTRGIPHG